MEPRPEAGRRHWLLYSALLLALLATMAAVLAGGALVFRFFREVDYPGAVQVSDHGIYRLTPYLTLRRNASYRTVDPFVDVYAFYSRGFALGPEAHAQSNCILMARRTTAFYVLNLQMTVTLCDTAAGRMVYVMRSLALTGR